MTAKVLVAHDSAHSPLGPSSASRWINCPGSVQATAGMPSTSSSFALEGTAAHAVAEACEKLGVRAEHFFEWTVRVSKDGGTTDIVCDQEMVDGVNTFLDYVDDLPGDSFAEDIVHYDEWVPEGFGTLDRAKVDGREAHVADFKYGKGVQVYAEDNSQLKLYTLGFIEDYGWMYPDLEKFVLHVVQPRLDHADSWTISRADLLKWANAVVAPAALRASGFNAEFQAGEWCLFCKLRATCKVRAESVFATLVGEFENLDAAIGTELRPLASLTNEQIAAILPGLGNAIKWCEDIKAHAMRELAAARPVGDWKLVEGRSSRGWKDEVEVGEALVAAGVKKADLYTYKLIGVPAAEKILGKKHALFKTLVVKPPGSPTLAPASDKRAALKLNAATEFDNLDNEET